MAFASRPEGPYALSQDAYMDSPMRARGTGEVTVSNHVEVGAHYRRIHVPPGLPMYRTIAVSAQRTPYQVLHTKIYNNRNKVLQEYLGATRYFSLLMT